MIKLCFSLQLLRYLCTIVYNLLFTIIMYNFRKYRTLKNWWYKIRYEMIVIVMVTSMKLERKLFWTYLKRLFEIRKTFIINTHFVTSIDSLCLCSRQSSSFSCSTRLFWTNERPRLDNRRRMNFRNFGFTLSAKILLIFFTMQQ